MISGSTANISQKFKKEEAKLFLLGVYQVDLARQLRLKTTFMIGLMAPNKMNGSLWELFWKKKYMEFQLIFVFPCLLLVMMEIIKLLIIWR